MGRNTRQSKAKAAVTPAANSRNMRSRAGNHTTSRAPIMPSNARRHASNVAPANDAPVQAITIGIDFGTVATCVTFQDPYRGTLTPMASDEEVLRCITCVEEWEFGTKESCDVETTTMYKKIDHAGEPNAKWGCQVTNLITDMDNSQDFREGNKVDIVKHSKLLLHNSIKSKEKVDRIKRVAERRNVDPLSFVQDFFDFLYKYLFGAGGYFPKYYPGLMKCTITIALGCPASWDDHESEKILNIAHQAGMKDIVLVSEAETIIRVIGPQITDLKINDKVAVADAGGATFDLAMYVVKSVHPLELAECAIPDSALCGGVFVDENLRKLIYRRYFDPEEDTGDVELDLDWAVRKFEGSVKKRFGRDYDPVDLALVLPRTKLKVVIKIKELEDHVFDPVIEDMKLAIKDLLDRTAGARKSKERFRMIFSGGLCQNDYVMRELGEWFKSEDDLRGVEILKIPTSVAPNAKGLMLIGRDIDKLIVQRRTRKTIGLYNLAYYDQTAHGSVSDCGATQSDNGDVLVHEILWLVKYNQLIPASYSHRRARCIVIPADTEVMREIVYISDSAPPPNEDSTILPRLKESEKELLERMEMYREKIFWSLEGVDKDNTFETNDDGVTFVVNWQTVIEYVNNQLRISIKLQSKNGQVLEVQTSSVPLNIDLNAQDAAYISLGTLTNRHQRRIQLEV